MLRVEIKEEADWAVGWQWGNNFLFLSLESKEEKGWKEGKKREGTSSTAEHLSERSQVKIKEEF